MTESRQPTEETKPVSSCARKIEALHYSILSINLFFWPLPPVFDHRWEWEHRLKNKQPALVFVSAAFPPQQKKTTLMDSYSLPDLRLTNDLLLPVWNKFSLHLFGDWMAYNDRPGIACIQSSLHTVFWGMWREVSSTQVHKAHMNKSS